MAEVDMECFGGPLDGMVGRATDRLGASYEIDGRLGSGARYKAIYRVEMIEIGQGGNYSSRTLLKWVPGVRAAE